MDCGFKQIWGNSFFENSPKNGNNVRFFETIKLNKKLKHSNWDFYTKDYSNEYLL